ncbi:DUF3054 domain-containing protein [Microbacterium caowuchunii]|uniref:DUF3054 domain-containing protein n=1 Tax=Microbacterium caowuchunii TaxID=2614638 RepID=UPI0012467019|nr:DUF3054 domain-containing protein [Microbacterium caowuchunii]QEV99872.1 DUF3054 domain-containing protein [Microbacterium caowuchunii]
MSVHRAALAAFALDAFLVTVFAAIGRATHEGDPFGPSGSGLAHTAWPFLISLVAAWLIVVAWRRPAALVRTGVPVWAITVTGGMLLRAVSGQGTAVAFIIVATVTLLAFLVGWRTIAAGIGAVRSRRAPARSR